MVKMVKEPKYRIIRQINKCQNQVRLTIPKEIADRLEWHNKDAVEIKEKDGVITVEKI